MVRNNERVRLWMEQAFRTREYHVIAGRDGRPELLYDLERTQVFSIAPGNLSDAARAVETSLIDHEVVTWSPRPPPFVPPTDMAVVDVTLDIVGVCNMGCKYCFEADIGARRGPMTAQTIDATIDTVFSKASAAGLIENRASSPARGPFALACSDDQRDAGHAPSRCVFGGPCVQGQGQPRWAT